MDNLNKYADEICNICGVDSEDSEIFYEVLDYLHYTVFKEDNFKDKKE